MTTANGIYAALMTPFKEDNTLSHEGLGHLIEYILSNGVDGLYVAGSSGEAILQSIDERATLLEEVARIAKSKCKLIAQVGCASTDEAVHLAKVARDAGYDSVSAIPPYYYPHSAAAIIDYYEAIADAAGLPLIIYNLPALTGVDLGTEGLLKLLSDERISGIKYTAQDLFQFWQLRQNMPNKSFYFGTDEMFLGAAAMGAEGGIGSTYNLIGDVYVDIRKAVASGNIDAARALQNKANELISILLKTGVLPGLKHALNHIGVPVGRCRKPFKTPSKESLKTLETWLDNNLSEQQLNFMN